MSISLSSCFQSQLGQNNNMLSDRQSYFNDSLVGQVHDFGKDINQMENMITSMEEMSKDIRLHLLDLQTMPGATNACSHFQQQTEHFESMVDDQLRSSLQRLSPVIMQTHLSSGTKPYTASEWRHQTPLKEVYTTITGGHTPQERTGYEFCTPPDFVKEPESRQVQANNEICRRRLQFENNSEDRKVGFGNINSFTKEDHTLTNQTTATNKLDSSHFTACLDQTLKDSAPKEKSSDISVTRQSETQTTTAIIEPTDHTRMIGTDLSSKPEEKTEEPTTFVDSDTNVNLQDLVSQAAKLLDNNAADLCIDTDSMVDSMLSEIREAFNQNVERVFKDVNTSELLSKQLQEKSYRQRSPAKKITSKSSSREDSDVSFCDENPDVYEMKEDVDDVDYGHQDYNCYRPPSPSPMNAHLNADFGSSTWRGNRVDQAWAEGESDTVLLGSNRRRKKKKNKLEEEEVEEEVEEDLEEEEEEIICPYITGGVRPQKGYKLESLQPKKKYVCDNENKHNHQKRANSNESEERLVRDLCDNNSSAEWTDITPNLSYSKYNTKNKRHGKRSQHDKKSREVHFSDTVYLISSDGNVRESEILLPQGTFDHENRSRYGKYSTGGGHFQDLKAYMKANKKHGRKLSANPSRGHTLRHEADLTYKPVSVSQERTTNDKSVMTPWDISDPAPGGSSAAARTKEWNDPSSPRTRTENWKCNSRVEDEQNGIFKSLTIESVLTDKTLPSNPWKAMKDQTSDNSQRNGISGYNIAGGCGPNCGDDQANKNFPDWQDFENLPNNLPCSENSSDSQMAFVCCILPQSIQNSNNRNTDNPENVYISNMMLTDLKGEDLKNPQKIGQPIESSEAKKVSYLVRELMEHLNANENFTNKNNPTDNGVATGPGSSPPGRKMSWVDAVKPGGKGSPSRLSQCGSPILFCYLPPEFLPKAHQVKSLKKPSKEPRKTMDSSPAREKVVKKSTFFNKGCQTENNSRVPNSGNQSGLSWWISAPPRVRKTPSSRIQQIYTNKLPPPVPVMTMKSLGKESRPTTPERKPRSIQSPYNKKAKLGSNSSPSKKKPFLV